MQLPSHIFLSYLVYTSITPTPNLYLVPFLIASVALDLDHIPAYIMNKKKYHKVAGTLWRTRLHELYGLILFSFIILIVWFFNHLLAQILAVGIIMHYIIDFLTGETRPFYPYSKEKIQIFFIKNKQARTLLEILLFAGLIGLILWKM